MTLTMQTLMDAVDAMGAFVPKPQPRIIFTAYALKEGDERLFPESKNRSARIRKKLIKRHGGVFRKVPCMWEVNGVIYAHPALRGLIEDKFPRLYGAASHLEGQR